jgi:hypothetical protein
VGKYLRRSSAIGSLDPRRASCTRSAISRRQWLASAVLTICAALVTLALAARPFPLARGQRLIVAFVVCSPIMLLRRWPLPVLPRHRSS